MNLEAQNHEVATTEEPSTLRFVVDTDLVHVGGGSSVLDY
jgi:hypothetical protein